MTDITHLPFDIAEIRDPKARRAIIEIGRGPRPGPFNPPQFAGGVGVVVWGCGAVRRLWCAGYASSDDVLRAMGIRYLIVQCGLDVPIVVHTKGLRDQLEKVSLSSGLTAKGEPYHGYDVLKPLQNSRQAGHWTLACFRAGDEPAGHCLATGLAKVALKEAQKMEVFFSLTADENPSHAIVATDADPDPDGLLGPLKAKP